MVRFHRRKVGARKYKDFTLENLQLAVSDVRNGVLSIRDAAAKYGISKSTIDRKVKNQNMGRCGHPTIFSDNEENSLVTHLTTVAD